MSNDDFSRLKRQRYDMPGFIKKALSRKGLTRAYKERLPYQQNDNIGWMTRAKSQETIDKLLNQMLDELEKGDVYMKMKYSTKK